MTGLYNGWKLKDELGNFLDKFHLWKKPTSTTMNVTDFETGVFDEGGLEGCFVSLLVWIRAYWLIYLLGIRSVYLGNSFVSSGAFVLDYFQGI